MEVYGSLACLIEKLKRSWKRRNYRRLGSRQKIRRRKLKIAKLGQGSSTSIIPRIRFRILDAFKEPICINSMAAAGQINRNPSSRRQANPVVSSAGDVVDEKLLLQIYIKRLASNSCQLFI